MFFNSLIASSRFLLRSVQPKFSKNLLIAGLTTPFAIATFVYNNLYQ